MSELASTEMQVVLACLTQAMGRRELDPDNQEQYREAVEELVADYVVTDAMRYLALYQVAISLCSALAWRLGEATSTPVEEILRDLGRRAALREAQEAAGG